MLNSEFSNMLSDSPFAQAIARGPHYALYVLILLAMAYFADLSSN